MNFRMLRGAAAQQGLLQILRDFGAWRPIQNAKRVYGCSAAWEMVFENHMGQTANQLGYDDVDFQITAGNPGRHFYFGFRDHPMMTGLPIWYVPLVAFKV
jgi:hypothetical protein